jgi:hypothetical protein
VDHVLGMGTLNSFMQNSLYPQPLIETHLREWPGVREWLASAGVASDSSARDVVCDGTSGKCGIPAKILQKGLQVPIDPKSRQFLPKPKTASYPPHRAPDFLAYTLGRLYLSTHLKEEPSGHCHC